MSPRQFIALVQREEEIQDRHDRRVALVCMVTANMLRGKKRKPFRMQDFMPKKRKRKTTQQMIQFVQVLNAALGGKDLRRGHTDQPGQTPS